MYTSDFGGSDFGDFEGIDIDDLFGGMFGARGATGPIPGADHEAELELTVEAAYRGGRRSVTLSGPDGSHNYQVTVPPGVTDGQRIRLAGQGGQGAATARPATYTSWSELRRTPVIGWPSGTSTSTSR